VSENQVQIFSENGVARQTGFTCAKQGLPAQLEQSLFRTHAVQSGAVKRDFLTEFFVKNAQVFVVPEVSYAGGTLYADGAKINPDNSATGKRCGRSCGVRVLGIEQGHVFVLAAGSSICGPDYEVPVPGYLPVVGAFLVDFQHLGVDEEFFGEGVEPGHIASKNERRTAKGS